MAKKRLGILFSGGGRTVENLAKACVDGSIDAEVALVATSHAGCGGIERCVKLGLEPKVVDYKENGDQLSAKLAALLDEAKVDLVLLAGFIRFFDYPDHYEGRVLNIHPSLLPEFGGKGFYGDRVHRAVLESGTKFSGCTVHFVSKEYDQGPIILQKIVPVAEDDTPETLAARVFEQERQAYPEALRLVIDERIEQDGARLRIKESS